MAYTPQQVGTLVITAVLRLQDSDLSNNDDTLQLQVSEQPWWAQPQDQPVALIGADGAAMLPLLVMLIVLAAVLAVGIGLWRKRAAAAAPAQDLDRLRRDDRRR